MKPLNSLILIKYCEPTEKKTQSGLYVPPTTDNNAFNFLQEGEVLAVNPDCKHINVGDTVLFNMNATAKVPNIDDQRFVRTEDIYAVK